MDEVESPLSLSACQFRKRIRDLNYGLFLTIYPQAQYIELLLKKMTWKVI